MKIVIEKKYLILPINVYTTPKKLCFYKVQDKKQTLVMDFDCKLDFLTPTYTAYLDVSRFCGAELEYSTIPQMEFLLEQTDEKTIDALYQEEFRPTVHFTPQIGWINDPNGLVYADGAFRMCYQALFRRISLFTRAVETAHCTVRVSFKNKRNNINTECFCDVLN